MNAMHDEVDEMHEYQAHTLTVVAWLGRKGIDNHLTRSPLWA